MAFRVLAASIVITLGILAIGIAGLVPSPHSTSEASGGGIARGDVDCSGTIDLNDVRVLLGYVGGGAGSASSNCTTLILGMTGDPVFGDIDCSGIIDARDIFILIRVVAVPGILGKSGEPAPDCPTLDMPFPPEPSAYMLGIRRSGFGPCVTQGQQVTLEVYVEGVPGSRSLRSFSLDLNIASGGLRIDSIDIQHLLASGASGPLVSNSDATPSTAATYHVGVEDMSNVTESGSGILVKLGATITGSTSFAVSIANASLIDSSDAMVPAQVTSGTGFVLAQPGVPCTLPSTGGRP
jgi:hypothetical protein